uniref:FAS1 domain-containing protein n=1 Tax=Solanum lycopersicum TaxID=4081 RepID=A0A3Q7HL06_SOLLC
MAFFNTIIAFTFFFFFLLSCPSSTQTPPPPSSAHAAAAALRNRGYSLFASIIDSTNNYNFSGTIFAPPDFSFSANIRPSRPRPSSLLLRYHTLKPPLTWAKLFSNNEQVGVQTLYNNNCLFFFKTSTGHLSISSTQNSIGFVKIRQPDIYVDNHLTVHGIDGVLDPTSARKCSVQHQASVIVQSQRHRRSLLDHAIRALRRRRFTVAATALTIKRPELLTLASLTVFAPSDIAFFSQPRGFHYDYRHHLLPQRYRFGDLATNTPMVIQTLAPNKTLLVNFVDGVLTVNGVIANSTEVYRNRWIVVLSVSMSLDNAGYSLHYGSFVPSPSPATMDILFLDDTVNGSVKSPSPETMEIRYPDEITNPSVESPSPETMGFDYPYEINNPSVESPSPETMRFVYPDEINNGGVPASMDMYYPEERIDASVGRFQSPLAVIMDERITNFSTSVESPSPATMKDSWCVFGMEGSDLLCEARSPSPSKEDVIKEGVAEYAPSDVKDESVPLISEEDDRMDHNHEDHLNIANDVFFYL